MLQLPRGRCVLIWIVTSSWSHRRSHLPTNQTFLVPSRSAFTEKSASRRIRSVGLPLTASLIAMRNPDIHGVFSDSIRGVPQGIRQLMLSRSLVMTHSRRPRPRFCWNFNCRFEASRYPLSFISIFVPDGISPPSHTTCHPDTPPMVAHHVVP